MVHMMSIGGVCVFLLFCFRNLGTEEYRHADRASTSDEGNSCLVITQLE